MSIKHDVLTRASIFTFLILAGVFGASAQSTIFNIPTAATWSRGSFLLEGDFIAKPVKFESGGFRSFGYRTVYGLDHKTEIGANFFFTRDAIGSTGEVQFNAKRNLYRSEKHAVSVSAGTVLTLPLRSRRGARPVVFLYANASKSVKQLSGMTFTGGTYTAFGGQDYGTKSGVMVGFEKPIAKRISFLTDWSSGKNRLGYAAAGLNYNISSRQFLIAGYNFGNSGRGNNAMSVFYGYTF